MTAALFDPEPIYIGEQPVLLRWFLMARDPGEPPRIEGFATLIGETGSLTLDAIRGEVGKRGEPSPVVRPQWASTITDPADLPDAETLDDTDNGRAWYINGSWHIYDEGGYHVRRGSLPGPRGITPNISMTAEQIAAPDPMVYGPIDVEETGALEAPNFHFKVPGVVGPEGPMGSIEGVESNALDFIRRNADNTAWEAVEAGALTPKMYTIPHTNFIAHTGGESRFMIASLNLPAQDFDWYPDVSGHIQLSLGWFSSIQVEVEVRIGTTDVGTGESEQLCGLGPYDPCFALFDSATIYHIDPHWSDTANPSFALSPDTEAGRMLAGETKTIYVFLHKLAGSGSYVFTNTKAHLRVMVVPVS